MTEDPGDISFIINELPHHKYKRKGKNLYTELEITLEEALIGGKTKFRHLDGAYIDLMFEPNRILNPQSVLAMEGFGLPDFKSPKIFGNLYLMIKVKFPKELKSRKLFVLLDVSFNI